LLRALAPPRIEGFWVEVKVGSRRVLLRRGNREQRDGTDHRHAIGQRGSVMVIHQVQPDGTTVCFGYSEARAKLK
jgi:hypothetical protein